MKIDVNIEVLGQEQVVTLDVPTETIAETALAQVGDNFTPEMLDYEDPHFYRDGENGLTVSEAARKATKRIMEMFRVSGEDDELASYLTVYNASTRALLAGADRGFLYRLGGGILKGYRDEGQYVGLPLAVVFDYRLNQSIVNDFS